MAYCPNSACPARNYEQLIHFVSQGAMDMRGLGASIVFALVEHGLVRTAADFYDLTPEKLMTLPGIKEKTAANLISAIERSKRRPFQNVVFALGIRFVGYQNAEILAAAFRDMGSLRRASHEDLESVQGIGAKMAGSVAEWFEKAANQELVDCLSAAGLTMHSEETGRTEGPLSGLTFLLTGHLDGYSRSEAETALKALGGRIAPGMSKAVDYLIAGADAGSKLAKATTLGTEITDEAWLAEVLDTGRIPDAGNQ
jgi:DNA ligase (NAD+)